MDAAGALGDAGQGVHQGFAASAVPVWLGGVRDLASDGGHADGQGDQGEEGLHDDELLRSGKLENVIEKKLRFNEL